MIWRVLLIIVAAVFTYFAICSWWIIRDLNKYPGRAPYSEIQPH